MTRLHPGNGQGYRRTDPVTTALTTSLLASTEGRSGDGEANFVLLARVAVFEAEAALVARVVLRRGGAASLECAPGGEFTEAFG